jgi:hypothetical protein
MVGAGTSEDPRRPEYAPLPNSTTSADGIIAFSYQVSDDGQFALVEFVARNRAAFKELLADNNPAIKCSSKARQTVRYHSRFPKTEEDIDVESLRAVAPRPRRAPPWAGNQGRRPQIPMSGTTGRSRHLSFRCPELPELSPAAYHVTQHCLMDNHVHLIAAPQGRIRWRTRCCKHRC